MSWEPVGDVESVLQRAAGEFGYLSVRYEPWRREPWIVTNMSGYKSYEHRPLIGRGTTLREALESATFDNGERWLGAFRRTDGVDDMK